MAAADLAVFCNRAGNTEGLQANADGFGSVYGSAAVLFDGNGSPDGVGPAGIFKGNGLNILDDLVGIEACALANIPAGFYVVYAVFLQHAENLIFSSVIAFE